MIAATLMAAALDAAAAPEPATIPQAPPAASPGLPNPLDLLSLLDLDFHVGPWKFRGYLQFDAADFGQDPPGPPESDFRRGPADGTDSGRARELQDGTFLRRARLGGEGTLGPDIAYRAMFELGANGQKGNPRIAEVWVSYRGFTPWVVAAGAFPPLTNMEDATSSDSLLFLERATAADLARSLGGGDGRLGVTLRRASPRWMMAFSLTGPVIDHAKTTQPRAAIVARVSRTLSETPDSSLHLGASATYVLVPARQDADVSHGFPLRLAATPEVDVDPTQLIDTGEMAARHASVVGLEFAAQRRNFFIQAEAFRFGVERPQPQPGSDPAFWGWYVEGSWILTGERRRFDRSRAAFWFPTPKSPLGKGGWGAWELAFRYSRMDLNARPGDPGAPPPPGGIRGGDQRIAALALEWYPRSRLRITANYLRVWVDRLNPAGDVDPEPFGPAPGTPPVGVQIGQTLNIFAIRARVAF